MRGGSRSGCRGAVVHGATDKDGVLAKDLRLDMLETGHRDLLRMFISIERGVERGTEARTPG